MIPYDPKWPNYNKERRIVVLALMKEHHPDKLAEYYKGHYARHRAKNLARMEKFRRERPERVLDIRRKTMKKHRLSLSERQRMFYQKNLDRIRVVTAERKFGLPAGGYAAMMESQLSRCPICGVHQSEVKKRFAVDHCHATGKIRALLCCCCNWVLGHVKDNPQTLRTAADYLDMYSK